MTWTSSDPSVVTITALRDSGFITAVAPGTATVTVTDGTVSSSCQITVTPVETLAYTLTYSDETATITVTKEWFENAWCYIAHLEFTDYTRFSTDCANGAYDNGKETASHAAERLRAVLTVNGDYSAPSLNQTVVRGGILWNGSGRKMGSPAVYSANTGLFQCAWSRGGGVEGIVGESVDRLVSDGTVTDTFCFGPPVLINGEVTNCSNDARAQRTFIGTNGTPGDIWIVVAEGRYRDGASAGLTDSQCARLLIGKGCTFGVPLDGGGSSTMVFQGEVLNSAKGQEREIVDFVYFR